jgi:hypothetical protein
VDGRMKVKLDTRFFSHFRLGSKGKIDFSKNLQAQEVKIFIHFNVTISFFIIDHHERNINIKFKTSL